ncbi:LOB domain-containing protein 18 [Dichanthelium oligosanthes]|uniref:LOB domain-containing protein 18 n=1 Tax=Dichanthelium oligosanthes TaxID=888268 RepID=A0A1E5UT08_9POAL|nr:LOB domain-containing protein 18 [Dichanthelium oligosanthes]
MSSSVAGASAGSSPGGPGGSSVAGAVAGVGGGGGGPCGACKFLRRKCVSGCIFAPYFDSEQGAVHFAAVHKVFGASNVSKLLLQIPPNKRLDAVVTVCYEAQARLRDPIYGCVSHIFALEQQVVNLQAELTYLQGHLTTMELPTPPPFAGHSQMPITAAFSVSNLTPSSNVPATVDLSNLLDPQTQSQQWAFHLQQQQVLQQQQLLPQPQYNQMEDGSGRAAGGSGTMDGGDLQALARELLDRHGRVAVGSQPEPPTPATQ